MDKTNQSTIQSLQQKLRAVKPANPAVKEHIDRLNYELNQYINLANPDESNTIPALQIALQNAIESFEEHHPDLAEALRIAINTLVNAGI